ncbi:MAG: mucoidy inhibitor MuiA family protein [bacterium]|nr:mucoidy inhibitor MuiA family protein [bacterium]
MSKGTNKVKTGQYAVDAFIADGSENRITNVAVFTNQAYVRREVKTRVKKGLNRLRLEIKAFDMDGDSVQAAVHGKGEVLSIQYKEMPLKEAPQKSIRDLEKELTRLKRKKRAILDQKEVLTRQGQFVNSLVEFAKIEVPREIKTNLPTVTKLQKTLDFLKESYGAIIGENRKLDFQADDLEEDIRLAERKLETLARCVDKHHKVVEVIFKASQAQEIGIHTSYVAYNASWEPVYKVDIPLQLDTVNLTMFSMIRQQTGEDWTDVILSVSNVVPLKGMKLPVSHSWYLELPRPKPVSRRGTVKKMAAAVPDSEDRCELPPEENIEEESVFTEPEAMFSEAVKKELPNAFEYELPQFLNINSTDQETILPLFSRTLEGEFFYHLVPRVQPMAFLVCRVKAGREMLAGVMNLYFGGRFVGCKFLDEKKPGEAFELNLGAERGLKVTREKLHDKLKETFLGKFERQTVYRKMAFKTVLENMKDKPVSIELFDSIPVSTTDKIEVKVSEIKPKPSAQDYRDKEGTIYWSIQLEPEETAEFRIGFSISYPKESPPVGL